jgi:hypothetical protein
VRPAQQQLHSFQDPLIAGEGGELHLKTRGFSDFAFRDALLQSTIIHATHISGCSYIAWTLYSLVTECITGKN